MLTAVKRRKGRADEPGKYAVPPKEDGDASGQAIAEAASAAGAAEAAAAAAASGSGKKAATRRVGKRTLGKAKVKDGKGKEKKRGSDDSSSAAGSDSDTDNEGGAPAGGMDAFAAAMAAAMAGGSAGTGGHVSDDSEPFVTQRERQTFKADQIAQWARTMPSRMRHFVEHSRNEVAMRIYKEVVVRFPAAFVTSEEVLGLTEGYGVAVYVGRANQATGAARSSDARDLRSVVESSRAPTGDAISLGDANAAADAAAGGAGHSSATDDDYCHIVRFEEGIDAVRCVLALNGAAIDPTKHAQAVQELRDALSAEADARNDADAKDAIAAALGAAPLIAGVDGTPLIFITADFFRAGFALPPKAPQERRSRAAATAALLLGRDPEHAAQAAVLPPRSALSAGRQPNANRAGQTQLRAQLRGEALALAAAHGAISSYGIEWEQFCYLVNYFHFLHAQRVPYAVPPPAAAAKGAAPAAEELCLGGAVRTVHQGLQRAGYDAVALLKWIDTAADGEAQLLTGRSGPSRSARRRWSFEGRLFLLLIALVVVLCVVLYLFV